MEMVEGKKRKDEKNMEMKISEKKRRKESV